MGLTKKREEHVKKMPYIETKISKSKDGKYLIHRTVLTNVRPLAYYQAILDNTESVVEEDFDMESLTKALEA